MLNISIVAQGGVLKDDHIDEEVINNIAITRKNYPEAEIIISTWNISDENYFYLKSALEYLNVKIILNDDPGTLVFNDKGVFFNCNVNRLIVSSLAGIREAKHEIIVKIRTDSCLYSDKLNLLIKRHLIDYDHLKREKLFSVFSRRVINCNLFARDARGYMPYLFHPGDIMLAGYKADLEFLFDIPLSDNSLFRICSSNTLFSVMKYSPEQYLWVKCIEKFTGKNVFSGNHSRAEILVCNSERYYVSNYIPFDPDEIGFRWNKYRSVYHSKGKNSVYNYHRWYRLHQKYIADIKLSFTYKDYIHSLISNSMKVIYFIRTSLLKISFIRRLGIKLFSKRG